MSRISSGGFLTDFTITPSVPSNRVRAALGPDIKEPRRVARERRHSEFERATKSKGGLELLKALVNTALGSGPGPLGDFFDTRFPGKKTRRRKAQEFNTFIQKTSSQSMGVARQALREGVITPDEARSLFGQIEVSNILPPDVITIKKLVEGNLGRIISEERR